MASLILIACLNGGRALAANSTPDPNRLVGCYISMGCWNLLQVNEQFSELSDSGVNFVIDYALQWPEGPADRDNFDAYMAIARREGISIGYSLFNALEGATPRTSSVQVARALAEVEALRNEEQIGAWYVHDEILPMLSGVDGTEKYSLSLGQMRDLYQSIRRIDPDRPQICVWNQLPDRHEMNRRFDSRNYPHGTPDYLQHDEQFEQSMRSMIRDCCDWVMVDCYPVGAHWLDDGHSIEAISYEVDALVRRANELRKPSQPLILVFQSFDWRMYGKGSNSASFPTLEQMRAMVQAGFNAGADNVLAYSWFDLVRKVDGRSPAGQQRCLADLKQILSELGSRH
ncbi:hypothetical protein KDL29_04320 [bacterium]|nr:hypothetical protein [bacterium]